MTVDEILRAKKAMDEAKVPTENRCLYIAGEPARQAARNHGHPCPDDMEVVSIFITPGMCSLSLVAPDGGEILDEWTI